jgi:hypothetical protein
VISCAGFQESAFKDGAPYLFDANMLETGEKFAGSNAIVHLFLVFDSSCQEVLADGAILQSLMKNLGASVHVTALLFKLAEFEPSLIGIRLQLTNVRVQLSRIFKLVGALGEICQFEIDSPVSLLWNGSILESSEGVVLGFLDGRPFLEAELTVEFLKGCSRLRTLHELCALGILRIIRFDG